MREKPSVGTRVDTFLGGRIQINPSSICRSGTNRIPARVATTILVKLPRALLTLAVGTLGHDQSHSWANGTSHC
eukprot:3032918-Rhodomonas_salina.1